MHKRQGATDTADTTQQARTPENKRQRAKDTVQTKQRERKPVNTRQGAKDIEHTKYQAQTTVNKRQEAKDDARTKQQVHPTVHKRRTATDTTHTTQRARTTVNGCQGAMDNGCACATREAQGQVPTNHTPRDVRTWATQPTHRASSRSGTPSPLVRAWPSCIGDYGKYHPEPWKQPVTAEPVHSPGGSCLPSSAAPQLRPQVGAVVP